MTTSSIIAAGGGDYTTIAAWEAASDTTSSPWIGRINDTSNYNEDVTINGASTVTNYIRLEVASPHLGAALSTSYARMDGAARRLNITADYVELYGLQLRSTAGAVCLRGASVASGTGMVSLLIDRCLVIADPSSGSINAANFVMTHGGIDRTITERNCVFIAVSGSTSTANRHQNSANTGAKLIVNQNFCANYSVPQNGCVIQALNAADILEFNAKNNFYFGGNAGLNQQGGGTLTLAGSNNIANDATVEANFTSSFDSVAFVTSAPASGENVWATSLTAGVEDFTPPTGAESNAFNTPAENGITVSGITFDIRGLTRNPTTPWIGPFEIYVPVVDFDSTIAIAAALSNSLNINRGINSTLAAQASLSSAINLALSFNVPYGENLLTRSEEFDNAAWLKLSGITVTPNTDIAPDGTLSADTVNEANTTSSAIIYRNVTVPNDTGVYTASIFVKKTVGDPNYVSFQPLFANGTLVNTMVVFNTDTGVVSATLGPIISHGVVDEGDYWRVYITLANNASGNTRLQYSLWPTFNTTGTTTQASATVGSKVIWGAQLNKGSLQPYIKTVAAAVSYPHLVSGLTANIVRAAGLNAALNIELAIDAHAELTRLISTTIANISAINTNLSKLVSVDSSLAVVSTLSDLSLSVNRSLNTILAAQAALTDLSINIARGLGSSIPIESELTAQLNSIRAIGTTIANISELVQELDLIRSFNITIPIVSGSNIAEFDRIKQMSVILEIVSVLSVELARLAGLNSSLPSSLLINGAINRAAGLSSSLPNVSALSTALRVARPYSSSINAVTNILSSLDKSATFGSDIVIASAIAPNLYAVRAINTTLPINSNIESSIIRARGLSTSVDSSSVINSVLFATRGINGQLAIVSDFNAVANVLRRIGSTIPASSLISADIIRGVGLGANVDALSELLSSINLTRPYGADIVITSDINGTFNYIQYLSTVMGIASDVDVDLALLRGFNSNIDLLSFIEGNIDATRALFPSIVLIDYNANILTLEDYNAKNVTLTDSNINSITLADG